MASPLKFDESLQKLSVLFKYSGMNLINEIITPYDTLKHRWLFTFNFLWVLSATIASFYYIVVGASQGKDFIELTSVAPCVTFTILAITKSFFHMINEREVDSLIKGLRDLEMKENERTKCAEKEDIILEDRGFLNTVINILYFSNCSMIVVFDMTPLLLMAVKYFKTNEVEMLLPYLDVFSFIPYEFKYWPFAYIHQVWSECIVLLEMGAADYLFFTYCTYIKMQFRLLKHDFERVIVDSPTVSEVDFRSKFTELVKWHQDLIDIFHEATGDRNGRTRFCCSMEVDDAVYNAQWYILGSRECRDLLKVQTRAMKPCKLTASGFADVNLRAFMKVLSTSWSYFALLQTVYAGK